MDWLNVGPDVRRLMNKRFTPGRAGHKTRYIVRHHKAGVLPLEDCCRLRQTCSASAH
ncbi:MULTISPECIES: hypothetical protein [Corynebacterium]|uniref:hypothetical protein n=1 Tax=Corynebacterium TaxID=1716 RepID=UPI0018658300|nr:MULTISPECIES: hypothetical protein [Corynebacterium]